MAKEAEVLYGKPNLLIIQQWSCTQSPIYFINKNQASKFKNYLDQETKCLREETILNLFYVH